MILLFVDETGAILEASCRVTLKAVKAVPKTSRRDPWRANEEARRRQLREDGRRPLSQNLAEGLALSEFLSTFTGSARRQA
jgi:hypothetical protein